MSETKGAFTGGENGSRRIIRKSQKLSTVVDITTWSRKRSDDDDDENDDDDDDDIKCTRRTEQCTT